jgi:hypothetical protein
MPLIPLMADSTDLSLVPDKFTLRPNGVLVYKDGRYVPTRRQLERFERQIGICVTGRPEEAHWARELDVERFDATPEDVPDYWEARDEFADDFQVYCDRSTIGQVLEATNGREPWWHIATGDGQPWDPKTIAANVLEEFGVKITPAKVGAIQNVWYAAYDVSRLFGNPVSSSGGHW